ncbi:MAG: hypothetical protein ACRESR_01910 [Gammaproteobacteria bacterium]
MPQRLGSGLGVAPLQSVRLPGLWVEKVVSERMPAFFFGHGNPMNAMRDTAWSRAWAAIGRRLPRPRVVLSVSAHCWIDFDAVGAVGLNPAARPLVAERRGIG